MSVVDGLIFADAVVEKNTCMTHLYIVMIYNSFMFEFP